MRAAASTAAVDTCPRWLRRVAVIVLANAKVEMWLQIKSEQKDFANRCNLSL
jgi:hypothetical protein